MSEFSNAKRSEQVGVASICVLAAVLLLTNLGNPYLWQDEAQTALIAETILTHDFDGPVEGIVKFLKQNARPGDTVAITYGDLPLKFYTDLKVLGGLTGEDIAAARTAEWIIPRRHASSREERRVKKALTSYLSPKTHRGYEIDYPDTPFENREDPSMHRYRTERPTYPRVVVYGVKR